MQSRPADPAQEMPHLVVRQQTAGRCFVIHVRSVFS
jgi:hypothetical protein